jgi:catechol-2,3-dioxygenase
MTAIGSDRSNDTQLLTREAVMKISRVGRASLTVRNLEESASFYSKVLQLPVLSGCERADAVELAVGKSDQLALKSANQSENVQGDPVGLEHIAFVVGNNAGALQEAATHLRAHGVAFERVEHEEYESIFIRDPDGHSIELYYWPEW